MTERLVRIIVVEPGKAPQIQEVVDQLETYQQLVDGYIEVVPMSDGTVLVCNEEGKFDDLKLNWWCPYLCDVLRGTFFIAGQTNAAGDWESVTDEEIAVWLKRLAEGRY
jgi:hypothetical protein